MLLSGTVLCLQAANSFFELIKHQRENKSDYQN